MFYGLLFYDKNFIDFWTVGCHFIFFEQFSTPIKENIDRLIAQSWYQFQ